MSAKLIEKIKELEIRHNLITDGLIDAIWALDAETLQYEYISPSIEHLSGYTAEEFKNFTLRDRLTRESSQEVMLTLSAEKKKYTPGDDTIHMLEVELTHKHGYRYWAEIRAKFYKEKMEPLKIIGTIRDISEKKENEKQRGELIRELRETIRQKDELLDENRKLRLLLPMCSACKRIRDDQNNWWPLDVYISKHTDSEITHTICPDCTHILYNELS